MQNQNLKTTTNNNSTADQNLHNIFMQAPVAITILRGPEFIIELANSKALELWDRTHEQVINKKIFEPFPELKEQGWQQLLTHIYTTGERFVSEETTLKLFRYGKLEDAYINFTYEPLRDTDGNITGIIGTGIDVSVQVEARKKIEESEKQFINLIAQSPVAIAILKGREMIVSIANPAILQTWGKGQDVIGKSLFKIMPEIVGQGFDDLLMAVYHTGIAHHAYETKVNLQRNGKWEDVYYTFVYQPYRETDGKISGVAIIANEVTPQALANKKIFESENNFRSMVTQAPVAIAIFRGYELVVEVANKFYMEIIDRKEKDFIGKPLLEGFPELKGQGIIKLLKDVLNTGIPHYGNEFAVDIVRNGKKEKCYFNFVYYRLESQDRENHQIMVVANEVTDQLNARRALEESGKQFHNMVMQSPIAMAIFKGRDMVIDLANDTLLKNIWRKKKGEVEGRKLLDVFPELRKQAFPKLLENVFISGVPHRENEAAAYVQSADGIKKFYLDYEYAPLFETDGSSSGIMVTVADVTEKVEARQQVEESEQRLRLAIGAASLGTFEWDLVTQEFIASERLNEIFGFKENFNINHQHLINAFHPEDKPIRDRSVQQSANKGSLDYEARVIWPDQSIHWVKVYGKTVYNANHEPIRMHGTVLDITQEKKDQRALAESEQRLSIAVETAALGTFELDFKTDAMLYSNRFLEIFGRHGKTVDHRQAIQHIYPEDSPLREKAYAIALQTGKLYYEIRIIWPDQSLHWIRVQGKVIYDELAQPLKMLGTVIDITEEKNSVQALEESESRLRLATEAAALGTFDLDLITGEVICSQRYFEILGHKNKIPWKRENFFEYVHPDDVAIAKDATVLGLQSGTLTYTVRIIWKDKSIHWIKKNANIFFDNDRKPVRMLGTVRDITEEKNALLVLEESEARFKTVADTAPVMIWMSGTNRQFDFFNKGWIDFTGRAMEQEIGTGWTEGVYADDLKHCLDIYHSSFEARKEFYMEYRLKRSDGKYRWVSDKGIPRYAPDGTFLGYIGGCADIHEQKMAWDELEKLIAERTFELKKRNEELQQQKDFVDVILDASVDIISVFDTDMRYLSLNKKCEEIYGMKKEKMLGRKLTDLFPQTRHSEFYEALGKAFEGKYIHQARYRSVITNRHFETFFVPLKHEGRVDAVLAIAHDNTDIIEAAEKLQITNTTLEQKNRELAWSNSELEQYAYVASHDLQEPLRKIRTYSGILHENLKLQLDDNSMRILQKVINSAERMSTLIYDLLNFSRLIHPEKKKELIDLNKIVQNVINDFELTIQQKKAVIRIEKLPVIYASPLQMNQLFYNLLNNSLKFAQQNIAPDITIQAKQLQKEEALQLKNLDADHSYIDITISDNGIGFDQQYADHIFEVFKRLQNKNIYPGSGIGLALCRKIALNHHGDIYAEGIENKGAVFHIILPTDNL